MAKNRTQIVSASDCPTPKQMREFWTKVGLGQITKQTMQEFLRSPRQKTVRTRNTPHIIDCDANPFLPVGWKGIESHKKGGMLEWNPTKVKLYLSPNQQDGKTIKGHNLRKELENEPVLNANVLDYLLAHPELIPEEWKEKYVYFWGTIYRDSVGRLCVRYLCFIGGRWRWGCDWLGIDRDSNSPAACSQVSSD